MLQTSSTQEVQSSLLPNQLKMVLSLTMDEADTSVPGKWQNVFGGK